jgi:hypothetical protein
MISQIYQRITDTIKQWFELTLYPEKPVLIPIKVRQDSSRRYPPSKYKQY